MSLRLARNLPDGVPYTPGSPYAMVMNFLRFVPAYRRLIGDRLITSVTEEGEKHVGIHVKGFEGTLYFPRNVPLYNLRYSLPEQIYRWHWHYYQLPQTRVEDGDVVFDCGSAEGAFPFLNRHRKCAIYFFEPLPNFTEALQRTFAGTQKVKIVPSAVGEKRAQAYVGGSGLDGHVTFENTGRPVMIESIDEYCAEHKLALNYLKADLEGYEMNALRGAAETILKHKPRIAITTYHRKEDPVEICAWLKRVNPAYRMLLKGLNKMHGNPVMLHAW